MVKVNEKCKHLSLYLFIILKDTYNQDKKSLRKLYKAQFVAELRERSPIPEGKWKPIDRRQNEVDYDVSVRPYARQLTEMVE